MIILYTTPCGVKFDSDEFLLCRLSKYVYILHAINIGCDYTVKIVEWREVI